MAVDFPIFLNLSFPIVLSVNGTFIYQIAQVQISGAVCDSSLSLMTYTQSISKHFGLNIKAFPELHYFWFLLLNTQIQVIIIFYMDYCSSFLISLRSISTEEQMDI